MSKINVKSRPERFRRAGIEFTRAGIELETEKLSEAQLAALQSEPNLIVVAVDGSGESSSKADSAAGKAKGRK